MYSELAFISFSYSALSFIKSFIYDPDLLSLPAILDFLFIAESISFLYSLIFCTSLSSYVSSIFIFISLSSISISLVYGNFSSF